MRVIAGEARGRRLEALPGTDVTRPTLSQVKEAMFSIVQFDLPGARVLDLYAGSGQLGIEALSRGAARCVFLDENREAVSIVMRNCKACGVFDRSRVNIGEAARFLSACREQFDLVLLDVMLPDIDGFELLRTIRAGHTYPVIMLTARDAQQDKIEGLSLGADDYVVKPFRPLELIARVHAQLRRYTSYGSRAQAVESPTIQLDGLEINRDARCVTVDGARVRLTPIEYSILLYLVEHRGSVVAVGDLFRAVWNEDFMPGSNNTVMVHIRHLREKIGDDAQKPRFIKNVWGVGYIIE